LSRNFVALLRDKLHAMLPNITPLHNAEKFVAALQGSLQKVELTSTSPKKLRDNFSCNLYRNKISRQVARKIT